jgi:hypothetical protein
MKKVIVLSMLACAMLLNAGCDSDDIAAGAIGVAIGIGIGDHDHYHHDRPAPYHPCHHCYDAKVALDIPVADAAVVEQNQSVDASVQALADKYSISTDAASKIQSAFDNVSAKGLASFESIGLNQDGIKSIIKNRQPESATVASLAAKLDMSEAQARDLFKAMSHEFELQVNDVLSPYWQHCTATRQWKTPQTSLCHAESQSGCSPGTGATLCY